MSLNVSLNADYPLSGNNIGGFEAYMFATVKKFIGEHTSFDEEIVIVDATGNVDVYNMQMLSTRMDARDVFNKLITGDTSVAPSPDAVSCTMIDFIDDDGVYDEVEIDDVYQQLKKKFVNWMSNNHRNAVMVQHFYQGTRVPHVHILYENPNGANSEFQQWLLQRWVN